MDRHARGWRSFIVFACGWLASLPALALDPDRAIGQLVHVWYENQLPQGTVLSIAQHRNGSMWLATYGGLVHHSGAGYESIDQRVAPALRSSAITAVGADRDGTLWVGTLNGGLYRADGRDLQAVALPGGAESVFGIVQDRAGALWMTTNAGVVRKDDIGMQLLGTESGFPPRGFYRAIVTDAEGGVWIAADGLGVVHWHDGRVEILDTDDGLPTNAVYSLAIDREGIVWAGTQAGPVRHRDGRFEREPRLDALDDKRIYSLFGDRDGNLWFAPLGVGICRLTATRFDCDDTLAGMRGETVRSMFEDREGNLWMGTTSSGVHRFSDSKLVTATGAMDSNAIRAVHEDRDGTLWVGSDGAGLARYEGQVLVPATELNAKLPSQLIRAIETDDEGDLWVGGTEGATRLARDGSVKTFGLREGLPGTIVFAFARSRDGGMWVGTLQGVARLRDGMTEKIAGTAGDDTRALYEAPDGRLWIGLRSGLRCLHGGVVDTCGTDGLPGMSVFAFLPEADGTLWIGTSLGLVRIRDGRVETFTRRAGFYGDAVFAILDDGDGHFWISSNRGIARLSRAELAALDAGAMEAVEPIWYGKHDGMLSSQANGASQTPAARTRNGRLWFGTANGVVIVDPSRLLVNAAPPPVDVERVVADGVELPPRAPGRLGPHLERIEWHYAAMSYVAPAAVRYRYRIEGFDRDWIDAGSSRVAGYTNLPPGDYVFRAIASNNDGVWNTEGVRVPFTVLPGWYETWWFRTLALLLAIGLLAGLHRLRLLRLREREVALTREVEQRTQALSEANAALQRLASLDGLTRIANRGAFDRCLADAWTAHAANREPLALLLCDIDAFKAYNDTYGHLAGDTALTAVARALSSALRSHDDVAARYGGEEFAILLARCDRDEASRVARILLDSVRDLAIEHRASSVASIVTVSIGVASAVPEASSSPDGLLQRADEALYRAKSGGRDRVVLDDPGGAPP